MQLCWWACIRLYLTRNREIDCKITDECEYSQPCLFLFSRQVVVQLLMNVSAAVRQVMQLAAPLLLVASTWSGHVVCAHRHVPHQGQLLFTRFYACRCIVDTTLICLHVRLSTAITCAGATHHPCSRLHPVWRAAAHACSRQHLSGSGERQGSGCSWGECSARSAEGMSDSTSLTRFARHAQCCAGHMFAPQMSNALRSCTYHLCSAGTAPMAKLLARS